MRIHTTSRHFKAHPTLVEYAEEAVGRLAHYYDGIIKGVIILNYEKPRNSLKIAEVNLSVHNATLTSVAKTDDFSKSIDVAVEKVLVQLKKYKAKLHSKDRIAVRRVRQKVV
ncbi:MAG: ribosome-associated translation inhibitor RaiA [Ignavibacteriales bacterium]|nr:ribosome-associated translation inhibitor RaiA [Ignavibacteriales bacterium]